MQHVSQDKIVIMPALSFVCALSRSILVLQVIVILCA